MNKKYNTMYMFLLLFQVTVVHGNIFESYDAIKKKLAYFGWKVRYYAPYVFVPAVGIVVAASKNKKVGAVCVGGYAAYATLSGMYMLYTIKQKYAKNEVVHEGWHSAPNVSFCFARWRQYSQADGIYWVTAWQLAQDGETVKAQFLKDLYAGKFIIFNAQGQRIIAPTPAQVFAALEHELQELALDKKTVLSLTNVQYVYAQPEEYCPSAFPAKLLWPNYNAASSLFIELDVMMKRLEKLRDIVAELRASLGGQGWPKIKDF